MSHRYHLCLVVLLASMLPRVAHAEDLKAVDTFLQFLLLAAFGLSVAVALLTIPIRLLISWNRLSVQVRWLWAVAWLAALVLTATVFYDVNSRMSAAHAKPYRAPRHLQVIGEQPLGTLALDIRECKSQPKTTRYTGGVPSPPESSKNLTIGFLVAFTNKDKPKSLVTIEPYVTFRDLSNAYTQNAPIRRGRAIGIRTTFPFGLPTKPK